MKKVRWLAAAAVTTGLAILANLPEGVTPTTEIETVVDGKSAFTIESSGDERLALIVVGYAPAADRSVESAVVEGQSMTRVASGSLTNIKDVEIWSKTGPPTGTLGVTVTMTDDADGELFAVLLADVDQANPIAGKSVGIGQGVSDATIPECPGDANLIFVMSSPSSETLSIPSGFVEISSEVGGTDTRLSAYLDDDSSAGSAALSFSGPVDYTAIMLGVNVAP